MINSLLYGLALIGVVLILRFYIDNDSEGQNDGSVGLLAMLTANGKRAPAAASQPSSRRSFRRKT